MTRIAQLLESKDIVIREADDRKASPPASAKDVVDRRQRREVNRLRRLHDTLADRVATLVQDVDSLKEISEAAAALDRLGRITDRLALMERQLLGLDSPDQTLGDDFARLLKNAWERAYGPTPPEPNSV